MKHVLLLGVVLFASGGCTSAFDRPTAMVLPAGYIRTSRPPSDAVTFFRAWVNENSHRILSEHSTVNGQGFARSIIVVETRESHHYEFEFVAEPGQDLRILVSRGTSTFTPDQAGIDNDLAIVTADFSNFMTRAHSPWLPLSLQK